MSDNRDNIRTKLRASVILDHPDTGGLQLHTRDISDAGAYVYSEGQSIPALSLIHI